MEREKGSERRSQCFKYWCMRMGRTHLFVVPVYATRRHTVLTPTLRRRVAKWNDLCYSIFLLLHPNGWPWSARKTGKVARHRHRGCFATLMHEHLRLLLAIEERGGLLEGSAFSFDDEGDDEDQLDNEPTAVDEVLMDWQLAGCIYQFQKGPTYFHPRASRAHGFTNWLNASVNDTTRFYVVSVVR